MMVRVNVKVEEPEGAREAVLDAAECWFRTRELDVEIELAEPLEQDWITGEVTLWRVTATASPWLLAA